MNQNELKNYNKELNNKNEINKTKYQIEIQELNNKLILLEKQNINLSNNLSLLKSKNKKIENNLKNKNIMNNILKLLCIDEIEEENIFKNLDNLIVKYDNIIMKIAVRRKETDSERGYASCMAKAVFPLFSFRKRN